MLRSRFEKLTGIANRSVSSARSWRASSTSGLSCRGSGVGSPLSSRCLAMGAEAPQQMTRRAVAQSGCCATAPTLRRRPRYSAHCDVALPAQKRPRGHAHVGLALSFWSDRRHRDSPCHVQFVFRLWGLLVAHKDLEQPVAPLPHAILDRRREGPGQSPPCQRVPRRTRAERSVSGAGKGVPRSRPMVMSLEQRAECLMCHASREKDKLFPRAASVSAHCL